MHLANDGVFGEYGAEFEDEKGGAGCATIRPGLA